MLKAIIGNITYKQVTIIRGLLFSLYLIFCVKLDFLGLDIFYIYLFLFVMRVLFNYNLEDYKYRLFPIISIINTDYNLDSLDLLYTTGLVAGTREYERKLSGFHKFMFWVSNLLASLVSCVIFLITVLYVLHSILKELNLSSLTLIVVVLLVVFVIYTLFSSSNKVKKEKVKSSLKNKI